jgi:hypothetical protein
MSSHPDANLHPIATGPARALVDQHAAEQPLRLYAGWFCPYVSHAAGRRYPWSLHREIFSLSEDSFRLKILLTQ